MINSSASPSANWSKEEKHATHVIELAKKLANGTRPGVFGTVDEHGRPHLRWMATISLQEFPLLYTITSPASRKVEHIRANAQVSWMFSDDEMRIIINITGKAQIVTDSSKMNRIWKMLEDKSKAYFLSIQTDGPGFAVVETEIEDIECVMPQYDFRFLTRQLGKPPAD